MEKQIYQEFGPLGYMLKWVDEHPTWSNIILWLMGLALVYVVFTYEFTIPMYQ